MRLPSALLVGLALLGACAEDETELVVVVYSDLAIPDELDEVRVDIVDPAGAASEPAASALGSAADLPRWVTLAHHDGPLGPFLVTATGRHAGADVVARAARVSFVEGETRVLRLDLLRECAGVACGAEESCATGGCRGIDVGPDELPPWPGRIDRLDGAIPTPECRPELCNDRDDDCDGMTDEGIDVTADPANCGRCGNVCPAPGLPGMVATCTASVCGGSCAPGWGDCDGMADNGCERELTTIADCGGCGRACGAVSHGVPACVDLECGFTCETDWDDCDGRPENGCETDLRTATDCGECDRACAGAMPFCNDLGGGRRECLADCLTGLTRCGTSCVDITMDEAHCGGCTSPCMERDHAVPVCTASRCGFACTTGFDDCDGLEGNGCETALDTLTDCTACGVRCAPAHGVGTCLGGECEVADCDLGFDDCNDDAMDGCETPLNTLEDCGMCGMRCTRPQGVTSCSAGSCSLVGCTAGFGNCDMDPGDGCETRLDTVTDCADCMTPCVLDFSTESCAGGLCAIGACEPGHDDCDGVDVNGCETPLDTLTDCGTCRTPCVLAHAVESCATRSCAVGSCMAGWEDCNGLPGDGCEADLASRLTCGSCTTSCSGGTPVCDSATRTCVSGCSGATPTRCVDTCVDTRTDVLHCGGCSMPCSTNHAVPSCAMSRCAIVSCDAGWNDCNSSASDGCETPLNTLTDCGMCGVACSRANASESCASGSCRIVACDVGFDDCDGVDATGCERSLRTTTDCGSCGTPCMLPNATATCATGSCRIASCNPGFGNCDMLDANGCETSLRTLTDCASCGMTCDLPNATETCASGSCAVAMCDPGWGDCNGIASDGCERSLRTLADCGGCGTPCALDHASESCMTGSCALVSCDAGWGNCDMMAGTGCERSLSTLTDCGGCGTPCALDHASESCTTGSCLITGCDAGWGNCDALHPTGCETDLSSTTAHCAMCGSPCPFPTSCVSSSCVCPAGCNCMQTGCATGSACSCTSGCPCSLDCNELCDATCSGTGTVCTVDAQSIATVSRFDCSSGAQCTLNARNAGAVNLTNRCTGAGTACTIDCRMTTSCQVDCTSGAACLLRCSTGAAMCAFRTCPGGAMSCPGGYIACNRPCP